MKTRGAVQLASLFWSFGVIVVALRHIPVLHQTMRAPAVHAPELLDMAVAVLNKAERFSSARVGFAGITPNEVMAWRIIAFRADAESVFVRLLDTATPAGQLYALAGLRFADESLFERAAKRLEGRQDEVGTVQGCIGGAASVAQLVAEIRKGEWVHEYLRGS